MKKILFFYKKHKIAAVFTLLWLVFMAYITVIGLQTNDSHIVAGIIAGIIMFIPGALIVDAICVVLSKLFNIFSKFSNAIKSSQNQECTLQPEVSFANPENQFKPSPEIIAQDSVVENHSYLLDTQLDYANSLLDRARQLANILNTTIDRDEFNQAFDEINDVLQSLTKFEGLVNFSGKLPSETLRKINTNKQMSIDFLEHRIKAAENQAQNEPDIDVISETHLDVDQEEIDTPDNAPDNSSEVSTTSDKITEKSIDADVYFEEAGKFVIEKERASVGILQRFLKIGYNRAARIIDQLYYAGIIGPENDSAHRKVLISLEEFEKYLKAHPEIASRRIIQKSTIQADAQNDKAFEFTTLKECALFVEKILEKPVDYSKDGRALINLQNMIITQASDQVKLDFLDDLIRYNSLATLQLILFDKNQFNFFNYRDIPNLFVPILFDTYKLNTFLSWLREEMQERTELFLAHHAKNIFEYNKKSKSGGYLRLPIFVIIIDELYGLNDIFTDTLNQILLDSGRRGVYIIGFSKMALKNLSLGTSKFLWKYYVNTEVSGLFSFEQTIIENVSSINYDSMEGHDFEYFCADLLNHNGFRNVSVAQGSGDQGIDILAEKEGVLYGVQCKCYSSDIGNKAVQEAFAGKTFYGCHVAAVLTNRHFTKSAIELAQVNKVLLWDREKLDSFIRNAE